MPGSLGQEMITSLMKKSRTRDIQMFIGI